MIEAIGSMYSVLYLLMPSSETFSSPLEASAEQSRFGRS
jgi:hypothetical protein